MIDPKLIAILRKVDLFSDIPEIALEQLAPLVRKMEFHPNQKVIEKGEEGNSLFIIAKGRVRVHDKEEIVARLDAGSFFGEISFLDTAPRSMSVTADEDSVLYKVSRDDFYTIFRNHADIFGKIVSTLTG